MLTKPWNYIVYTVIILFIGYNSIYIKRLSSLTQSQSAKFDATAFAQNIWDKKLPTRLNEAVELSSLADLLTTNKAVAFEKYSHAIAIGNYRYFLIKTSCLVKAINENDITVEVPLQSGSVLAKIATEFIYGNTVRDAIKLVDIKDFKKSDDLNNVSEAFNQIVRKEIISQLKTTSVKVGSKLEVVAAVELNKEHIKLNELELVPVQLKILK